eukprot:scaffold323866_cov58-Tisochrysis_lutea.AAC.1
MRTGLALDSLKADSLSMHSASNAARAAAAYGWGTGGVPAPPPRGPHSAQAFPAPPRLRRWGTSG